MILKLDEATTKLAKEKALNYWETLFCANNGIDMQNKSNLATRVKFLLEDDLKIMHDFAQDGIFFDVNANNNQQLDKLLNEVLELMKQRGAQKDLDIMRESIDEARSVMASGIATENYQNFKNVVEILDNNTKYPDAFKSLILNEVLHASYEAELNENGERVITEKPFDYTKDTKEMISLDEKSIEYIYQNATKYENFGELYMDAKVASEYEQKRENSVTTKEVEYNIQSSQGRWIKVTYPLTAETKNALEGTHLIKDEDCIDEIDSKSELYMFVDNTNKAQLLIGPTLYMRGNLNEKCEVGLVGIAADFASRNIGTNVVYQEDLDCAMAGLDLTIFSQKIQNGTFEKSDIPNLINALSVVASMRAYYGSATELREKVMSQLPSIKPMLAEHFKVKEEELYIGDLNLQKEKSFFRRAKKFVVNHLKRQNLESPKVIIGNVMADSINARTIKKEIGNVEQIIGNAYFNIDDQIKNNELSQLRNITGKLTTSMAIPNLESVGGELTVSRDTRSAISFDKLKFVGDSVAIYSPKNVNLNALQSINGGLWLVPSKSAGNSVEIHLDELKTIKGPLLIGSYYDKQSQATLHLGKLEDVRGNVTRSNKENCDLHNLKHIGGNAYGVEEILRETKIDGKLDVESLDNPNVDLSKIDVTMVREKDSNRTITKEKYQKMYMARYQSAVEQSTNTQYDTSDVDNIQFTKTI